MVAVDAQMTPGIPNKNVNKLTISEISFDHTHFFKKQLIFIAVCSEIV